MSTSKIKKEIKFRVTQFHTILKIRLLSVETNVRGVNTFLKRKYNSRTWNILYDRFPSVFPTFSTNKRWWRLRAFSSFGRRTPEPRLARPQKGRLRQLATPLGTVFRELGLLISCNIMTSSFFSVPFYFSYVPVYNSLMLLVCF